MKRPEPLEMYQPTTLQEASRLLKDKGAGGRFLAGGTDLVIAIKEKGLIPKYVVDLKKVPGLSGIRENADGSIAIGALTTMREIETDSLLNKKYPFLCQSAAEVGSIQIRNRATVGGNMANATPSADVAPSLIALNATAKIVDAGGERIVALEEFFRGPGQFEQQLELTGRELLAAATENLAGKQIDLLPEQSVLLPQTRQLPLLFLHFGLEFGFA